MANNGVKMHALSQRTLVMTYTRPAGTEQLLPASLNPSGVVDQMSMMSNGKWVSSLVACGMVVR